MVEAPTAIPKEERTGRLFPWTDKSSVYYWLGPAAACGRLGQRFRAAGRGRGAAAGSSFASADLSGSKRGDSG